MTRLLVKLCAANDTKYELEHHKQTQGLMYDLLRGSNYGDLHDRRGYKFFAFSNVFPFFDLRKGDKRNLIISSPNSRFISYLKEQLEYLSEIAIGAMKFKIDYCRKFDIILNRLDTFSLITGTPIISRIQKEKRSEDMRTKACWSVDHPIELFINQLEDNLCKKYYEYHGISKNPTEEKQSIFYKSRFLRQVSTKLFMNKSSPARTVLVGTRWLFTFAECNPLLQFALDAGLGELNSLGFGFMNVLDSSGRLVK